MRAKYVIAILCTFAIIISVSSYASYGGDGRDKDKCFDFVYPISYMMPDGSTITVENEDDWGEIKDWYEANPDVKEKPELQYPVDIIFKDGTIKTINNEEEMKSAYEYCWGKDDDDNGDDDDDDKDRKLNKAGRGRNRIRDRIRTYLEILRARLR